MPAGPTCSPTCLQSLRQLLLCHLRKSDPSVLPPTTIPAYECCLLLQAKLDSLAAGKHWPPPGQEQLAAYLTALRS